MEPKLRYTAVEKGDINLIDAYSTDAELKQYDMVVLKMINMFSHLIKVLQCLKEKFLKEHPEIKSFKSIIK